MRTRRSPNQEAARISSRSGTRHRRCRCCLPALTGFTTGRRGEADASHHKKARGHSGTIGPWPDFPRGSRPQIWRGSPAIADPPPLRGGDPTMPRDTVYNNSSELNEATVAAALTPAGIHADRCTVAQEGPEKAYWSPSPSRGPAGCAPQRITVNLTAFAAAPHRWARAPLRRLLPESPLAPLWRLTDHLTGVGM